MNPGRGDVGKIEDSRGLQVRVAARCPECARMLPGNVLVPDGHGKGTALMACDDVDQGGCGAEFVVLVRLQVELEVLAVPPAKRRTTHDA